MLYPQPDWERVSREELEVSINGTRASLADDYAHPLQSTANVSLHSTLNENFVSGGRNTAHHEVDSVTATKIMGDASRSKGNRNINRAGARKHDAQTKRLFGSAF